MNKSENARKLFESGANCAQSVFVAFAEDFGIRREDAFRLACGLGGGVGRTREVCGAVSAMALIAGMKYGSRSPDDKKAKDETYAIVQMMVKKFRSKTGSVVCRDLLGIPGGAREDSVSEKRTREYYARRPCSEIVAIAAEIAEEMLGSSPENFLKSDERANSAES